MTRRDLRTLAMQAMYHIDTMGAIGAEKPGGGVDAEIAWITEVLFDAYRDAERDGDLTPLKGTDDQVQAFCGEAATVAHQAWQVRGDADNLINELAPQWPIHRQPHVDRALLRLSYYEIVSGHAPVKVVMNEAVELAKQFAGEQSPSFINGVLDKMVKRLGDEGKLPAPDAVKDETPADPWLADAINNPAATTNDGDQA